MESILLSACFLGILFGFVRWSVATPSVQQRTRWRWVALGVFACALPLVRLLSPNAEFGYDWVNHEWMIAYYGEYLLRHHRFAEVFNSVGAVGMPQPVFYAFLTYPLLGTISAVLGAAWAMRLAACLVLGAQFSAVSLAARATIRDRGVSVVVAMASVGSVYALTNLYNRAAFTEFLASSLLVSTLAFGIAAICSDRRPFLWCAGAAGALMLGCHPPTALLGCIFVAVLIPIAFCWPGVSRRTRWTALLVGALVGLTLTPWVYANVTIHSDLGILARYTDLDLRPSSTDSLMGRFFPWPSEGWWKRAPDALPHIEAPVDGAIIILLVWNLVALARVRPAVDRSTRAAAWTAVIISIAWFIAATAISVSRTAANLARPLAPFVQFSCRFVSHANAGLLVATLFTGFLADRRHALRRHAFATSIVTVMAALVSVSSTAMKTTRASAAEEYRTEVQYTPRGDRANLILQPRADAAADYAAIRQMPQLAPRTAHEALKVSFVPSTSGNKFGVVPEISFDCTGSHWIVTNVVAFPWNRIVVDGHEADVSRAERWRAAFHAEAGHHILRYEWHRPRIWSALRVCGEVALWTLLLAAVVTSANADFSQGLEMLAAPPSSESSTSSGLNTGRE